jgi:phosphoribosylanthranilate isomerase
VADTLVKFCGCTTWNDVALAIDAGADAFGMIFAPSPRRIEWVNAVEIAAHRLDAIAPVAVFVDPEREEIERVRTIFPNAFLQFSGNESPEFVALFGDRAIKAIHVGDPDESLEARASGFSRALLLLDTYDRERPGGTGLVFEWPRAAALAAQRPVIVAGGLTPQNVAGCVRELRPYGVDVRSGVESDGQKDAKKMQAFVRAARAA